MRRPSVASRQQQLALNLRPPPCHHSEAILRSAFSRLRLGGNISFERAMANRAMAIGIRNVADAMIMRMKSARITH